MSVLSLLDRWFKREEINGHGRCPTYLYRWLLAKLPKLPKLPWQPPWIDAVYLHRFVGDDWSRDLHDHPKRFISIGLAGGYVEETPNGSVEYRAPWVRTFPASHVHRISLGRFRECWTLVIVLGAVKPWGFWHAGRWIHWKEYVRGESAHIADEMATCR